MFTEVINKFHLESSLPHIFLKFHPIPAVPVSIGIRDPCDNNDLYTDSCFSLSRAIMSYTFLPLIAGLEMMISEAAPGRSFWNIS